MKKEIEIFVRRRRTNPTASDDISEVAADDVGRIVMTPYQVRDLLTSGYAVLTRGVETAVIAGIANTLIDIVVITGANTSGVAQQVDIRVGTGGSIIDSLVVPAASVASKQYSVPLLANEVAQAWTAKNSTAGEHSDSPVSITMMGIQNV